MSKKWILTLAIIALMLALICVFASCGCEHEWSDGTCTEGTYCKKCNEIYEGAGEHIFGTWVETGDCIIAKETSTCVICGAEESRDAYAPGYHVFTWAITKEATCTADGAKEGTCDWCGKKETETISAGHDYTNGICTKCDRGLIDIKLPETPITVHDYSGSNIDVTTKMTSLEIGKIAKHGDGTYSIIFYWAGEKIYDRSGNSHSSRCRFGYKLYDSEGFVVYSSSDSSTAVNVGEKFKDQEFGPSWLKLDPNETYTLEILNVS